MNVGIFVISMISNSKREEVLTMKKKLMTCSIILSLIAMNIFPILTVRAASGDGTPGNPYIITTCTELQNMKNNLAASYALGNDIDCSDTVNWNSGKGFETVGNMTTKFTGNFDGKGFTITGLTINRPTELYLGLIGYTEGTNIVIQNVTLKNFDIRNDTGFTGTLVGYAYTGVTIKNIKILNTNVISGDYVGGLTGYFRGTLIDNVYVSGNIEGDTRVGGILSTLSGATGGTLSNATFNGTLKGTSSIGGLVGYTLVNVFIKDSSATGTITGLSSINSGQIGGLVGTFKATTLDTSYSRMNVQCSSCTTSVGAVGGMIGYMESGSVNRSYSTGTVTSNVTTKGGLIGSYVAGAVTNTYWDKTASGITTTGGNKGTAKTTSEMKTQTTFSGWDFSKTWFLKASSNAGYPSLYREVLNAKETHTANTVSLTWDKPSDPAITSFNIYRNGVKIGQINASSFQDNNLAGDTPYTYVIKTVDTVGNESLGTTLIIRTYDNIPPSAITNVTAAEQDDGMLLTWTNPSDTDVQKVIVKRNGDPIYQGLATSFLDTTINEKVLYTYEFQAFDENDNASPITSKIVTTRDKTPPQEVTTFIGTDEPNKINLSWKNPSDDDFDHVRVLKNGDVFYEGNGEIIIDNNVIEKQSYTYYIQTVDNAGNISTGVSSTVFVSDKTPPTPVSNLVAVEEDDGVRLTWENPIDDDIDIIQIIRDGSLIYSGTDTTYKDTDINEKTSYTYTLIAYDTAGLMSAPIDVTSATRDKTPPSDASDFKVIEGTKEVKVTWVLPGDDDVKMVTLYRDDVPIYQGLNTTYNDKDVTYSQKYTYKLVTTDTSGLTSTGISLSIQISDRPTLESLSNVRIKETSDGMVLSWMKPMDERFSHVNIYRNGKLLGRSDAAAWYVDKTIIPNQFYTYELVVVDTNGLTLSPISASLKSKDKTPLPVEKIVVQYINSKVVLKWGNNSVVPPKQYLLYKNGKLIEQPTIPYYVDEQIEASNYYVYRIEAVSETGLLSKGQSISISIPSPPVPPPPVPIPPVINTVTPPTQPVAPQEDIEKEPTPQISTPQANPNPTIPAPNLPIDIPIENTNTINRQEEKIVHNTLKKAVAVKKSKKGFILTWTAPEDVKKVLIYRDNKLIGETTKQQFEDILKLSKGTVTYKLVFVRANGKKMSTTIKAKVSEFANDVKEKASLEDSRLTKEQAFNALLPATVFMAVSIGAAVWVVRRKGY